MVIFLLSDFVYQPADQEKEKETDYDGGTGGNIQKGRKEQSGNRTGGTDQGGSQQLLFEVFVKDAGDSLRNSQIGNDQDDSG